MKRGRRKTSAIERQREAVENLDCRESSLCTAAKHYVANDCETNRRELKSQARSYAAAVRRVINSGKNP